MARNGKIARLPRAVREQLNERLDNGERAVQLADWLNGMPKVKKVLEENFGGRPISPQNLSEWKGGGFLEWQARQELLEQARELAADAQELEAATERRLTDSLATVLAARYAKVLLGWDGLVTEEFSAQLRALQSMCREVAELRRGDHSRERLDLELERRAEQRMEAERQEAGQRRFQEILRGQLGGVMGGDVRREGAKREDPPSPGFGAAGPPSPGFGEAGPPSPGFGEAGQDEEGQEGKVDEVDKVDRVEGQGRAGAEGVDGANKGEKDSEGPKQVACPGNRGSKQIKPNQTRGDSGQGGRLGGGRGNAGDSHGNAKNPSENTA